MRVSERQQRISIAQTKLELVLHDWRDEHEDIDDVNFLRAINLEIRDIQLDMEPKVDRMPMFSGLKDLIRGFQAHNEMTDIEVLQALYRHCEGVLRYMLRYERHGDYDKPAGLE